MDRVHCAACNAEHDLHQLEPSFEQPDACHALSPDDRRTRVRDAGDAMVVRDDAGIAHHFVRARLPIPVRGEVEPFHWIAWVELDAEAWRRVVSGGDIVGFPFASDAFRCPATLANDFPGYPRTLGLDGSLAVTDHDLRPTFHLALSPHPLAAEQRLGIQAERVLEIVAPHG